MQLRDEQHCILLHVSGEGQAALDVADQLRFNLPVRAQPQPEPGLRFEAGGLEFHGQFQANGARLAGSVRANSSAGEFWLGRAQPAAPEHYGALMGVYETPDSNLAEAEARLMLGRDDRPEGTLLWYAQGERVVRLHSLGQGQFLSERCELLTAADAGRSLAVQAPAAARHFVRTEPYQEEVLRIPAGGHEIVGSLLRPAGSGPHAAVVMCHLANTHTRDYYRLYAAPFAERGLAAFIYDKRGWGASNGARLNSEVYPLADDAVAVFDFLKRQPGLRPEALGFWGISNGAWVSALAASRVGSAAFVVLASAAGTTPARQEQVRRVNVAASLGASPRAQALLGEFWRQFFDYAVNGGEWTPALEQRLQAIWADDELRRLPPHPDHGPTLQPVPPRQPVAQYQARAGTWADGGFDPAPLIAALNCPVLAVWGEADTVVPLADSVERIDRALQQNGHPLNARHVLPRANHLLYTVTPEPENLLAESMHRLLHNVSFAPGTRALMAEWAVRCVQRDVR